jgi:hypothetical protein
MGAIERQVPQVKRKNSTSCNCPEANLTVVGSVASRFGPRDVATVWTAASVGAGVADASNAAAGEAGTAGAQAEASRTASAPTVERMMRGFVIKVSFACVVMDGSVYPKITPKETRFLPETWFLKRGISSL